MASCAIVGFDGLDVDVVSNLYVFYRNLGYTVAIASDWTPCDLLVVTRGIPLRSPEPGEIPDECHIYCYTGHERFKLEFWPASLRTLLIATSSGVADATGLRNLPAVQLHLSPPPVWVDFWERQRAKGDATHHLVHIGHFKQTDWTLEDRPLAAFVEFARSTDMKVWGRGWEPHLPARQLMGEARAETVSDMYSTCAAGAGLMYSWQRGKTFSGRFWQAPLAGCPLLSEVEAPFGAVPGVIIVDYASAQTMATALERCAAMAPGLPRSAREYWGDSTQALLSSIRLWTNQRPVAGARGGGVARAARFQFAKLQSDARLRFRPSYVVVNAAVRANAARQPAPVQRGALAADGRER